MNYETLCGYPGKYFLKKYKYIPSEYILKLHFSNNKGEINDFFLQNRDEVYERAKSTYVLPIDNEIEEGCMKIKYMNKTVANSEMRRIQSFIQHDYKPIRSYYCGNCSSWHLTSQSNAILEKFEITNKDEGL